MRGPRVDAGLPLPAPPERTPRLTVAEGVLALPGPAGPGPFVAAAGVVQITGSERGGIGSICVGGRDLLTDLTTTAGAAANVVATPAGLRRELVGPTGTTQEIILAIGSPPAAAIQWQAADTRQLRIRFKMAAGTSGVRYRTGEQALVLRTESGPDDHVVLLDPPPSAWTVVEAAGGGIIVEAETTLTADHAVTLMVAAASERGPAAGTLMRHLDTHARRAQSPPWEDGGIRLSTGVAELDEGLGWLSARIGSAQGLGQESPDECLWWGLGALAAGQHEPAVRAYELLSQIHPGAAAHAGLLAARIALTTGDRTQAREAAERVGADGANAAERMRADATPAGSRSRPLGGLATIACSALADALRYAAPEEQIEQLRDLALGATGPNRGLALPMAGREPDAAAMPSWLGSATEHGRTALDPEGPTASSVALIGSLAHDHADAYGQWRNQLATGLAGGPAGRGTWDPARGGAASAGALVCGLMHGLLGWDPDAPVGRLTLAPSLPRHLTAFTIHDLPVGDARMSLEYLREGRQHSYVLTPTAGGVPPTLVFKPRVAATGVSSVLVDGLPAELNVAQTRDRAAISVQIPLDGRRTVRLTAAGDA